MLTNVFVVSSPPLPPSFGRDIAMTASTDLSTTTSSRDSQGPSSSTVYCAAITSAIEGGRRFSELLPPSLAGHQRPPSPFAHEAEATTQHLANANVADGRASRRIAEGRGAITHPYHHHQNRSIREQSNSLGSNGTLSRSLSSPELLQLPFMNSQSATSSGIPVISATPSPLPTNELSLLSPVPPKFSLLNSASTQLNYSSSSSSLQSLKAQQSLPIGHQPIRRPKMQLNGTSILSIDIGKLTKKGAIAGPSPLPQRQHHSSGGSAQSDTKRNLISLTASVGNAIQRTKRELQRTRLWHAFYAFALPLYTLAGALIFQALDGDFDDHQRKMYEQRCLDSRGEKMANLEQYCTEQPGDECFQKMRIFLAQVENCYRRWHEVNKTITHPMSDFTNAVIYAFSVYTTIGYGTISASSTSARIATVFYGIFGIPLFFAFIKEEGNACRTVFIRIYNWLKRYCRQRMALLPLPIRKISASAFRSVFSKSRRAIGRNNSAVIAGDCESAPLAVTTNNNVVVNCPPSPTINVPIPMESAIGEESNRGGCSGIRPASAPTVKSTRFSVQPSYVRQCSDFSLPTKEWKQESSTSSSTGRVRTRVATDCGSPLEQRRVFLCGVLVFCVYLLMCSLLFSMMTGWDYFTAFYFLFNSVALIGFGDVFPKQPRVILVNMFFIVLGVVLFSMCYFILQEEIRVKAFEASRKARTSIAKYSQSLMLHTRPWSRRNSPAFDKTIEHFDRLRKRRQSAPAIAIQANGGAEKNVKRMSSGNRKGCRPSLKV